MYGNGLHTTRRYNNNTHLDGTDWKSVAKWLHGGLLYLVHPNPWQTHNRQNNDNNIFPVGILVTIVQ